MCRQALKTLISDVTRYYQLDEKENFQTYAVKKHIIELLENIPKPVNLH